MEPENAGDSGDTRPFALSEIKQIKLQVELDARRRTLQPVPFVALEKFSSAYLRLMMSATLPA